MLAGLTRRAEPFFPESFHGFFQGDLPWVAAALLIALAVGGIFWLRPRTTPWWALGLLPLVGVFSLGMPFWALADDAHARILMAGALEGIGGLLLLFSLIRWTEEVAVSRLHVRKPKLPESVRRLDPGKERLHHNIPLEDLSIGDRVRITDNDVVPADGRVVEGSGMVDAKPALGVPGQPQSQVGDSVYAGSLCLSGNLLFEVERLPSDSFSQRRFELTREVSQELLQPSGYAMVYAGVAWLVALVLMYWVTTDPARPELVAWVPAWLSLALGSAYAAPAIAQIRLRSIALKQASKLGLIFSSGKDMLGFGRIRSWQAEPRLLALPGELEIRVIGEDLGEDLLLIAADALAHQLEPLERDAFRQALERAKIEPQQAFQTKLEGGIWWGTLNGRRWFLCPLSELYSFSKDVSEVKKAVTELEAKGLLTYVIGQEDVGALGAIGIQMRTQTEVAKAASVLGARLQAGLPDPARKALARVSHIDPKPPHLSFMDGCLSAGGETQVKHRRYLVVLPLERSNALPEGGLPRILTGAVIGFAEGFATLKNTLQSGRIRGLSIVLFAALVLGLLNWLLPIALVPALGTAVGAFTLVAAAVFTRDGI